MARSATTDFRHATVIAVDFLAAKERGTSLKKLLEIKTEVERLKIDLIRIVFIIFPSFCYFLNDRTVLNLCSIVQK